MRLAGKVALITGAARGQGAAEARLFARQGAKVVLGDVLDEQGSEVATQIVEAGGDAVYVHLDVTSEDDWRRAIESAASGYGSLDVLVHNAGIWRRGAFEDTSVETYDQVMSVNVTSVFLGTKLAIPAMRRAGGGSIVIVSSTGGLVGYADNAAYSGSKGAVRLFAKSAAVQHGKDGIRVNSIHPGAIDTDMGDQVWPDARSRARTISNTLIGRLGVSEDIAFGALYLASDESSFVTGSELVIDGGDTAK